MVPDESPSVYDVVLSLLAMQDLADISSYIAADNPTAAERFGRELLQKTRQLTAFPEMGRVVPELAPAEKARELIHRSYRIIYRVDYLRRRVEVARFWHAVRGTPQV